MGGIGRSTGRWFGFQVRARRLSNRIPLKEHQKIYVLTLLIGALCGLAAVLFHLLLDLFQEHLIYAAASIQRWWMVPLVLLIPAAGGLIAGAFALVGMGAVFAGIVRAPVTSIIIIFEMTSNYSIILPLMVANITSYALATRLSPVPIYDALLLQGGIHLPHTQRHALRQIPVCAAMTRDVVTVKSEMKVSEAFGYVKSLPRHYHSYPVVDGAGALTGLFTFNDLKRALAAGKGKKAIVEIAGRKLVHAHPDHTLDSVIVKLGQKGA